MRRKTLYAVAFASLFCWILILQYFYSDKLKFKGNKLKTVNDQIENLENQLQAQIKANENLIKLFKNINNKDFFKNYEFENNLEFQNVSICILVFACNRLTIKRNLDQLLKYRPDENLFPIIVSQDCGHEPTKNLIESYGNQLKLIQHPDLSDIKLIGKSKKFKGYYKISRHYKWALSQVFDKFNYGTVIIVEDDLDIAPDFFEYFRSMYYILKNDSSLWCVSAWNDNGKQNLVQNDAEQLYRTDFFPGLGWMMNKDIWLEINANWPSAFWDDWIRQPEQRKDRACIRPEISRTKTFGKIGVSNGLFYEKHLKFIKLNQEFVPFSKKNLTYLLKENYDLMFLKEVYSSPSVTVKQLVREKISGNGSLRITYTNKDSFKRIAKVFGLMDDFKSGVPRTGYRGVVSFAYKDRRIYLAPLPNWTGYDLT